MTMIARPMGWSGFAELDSSVYRIVRATMLPSWASFVSRVVAFFVCGFAGINYMWRLYEMKAPEFGGFGLAVFGSVAALSGLCYTKASVMVEKERSLFIFCGEKFLHASMLTLQTLVLKFAQDAVSMLLSAQPLLSKASSVVFYLLFFACGAYAFYFIIFAFDDLNCTLWKRYLERLSRTKNYVH